MIFPGRIKKAVLIIGFCGLMLHLSGFSAFAAEGPGWRPTYDLIMRYVNFGILVFVLVRYGRKPLMNFLQGQSDEVAEEIRTVETRKRELDEKIAETKLKLEDSAARFDRIRARIIEEGERAKERIIEEGTAQAKKMLEIEKRKAVSRITIARQAFLAEMVDAATRYAQNRLPDLLTDKDHANILDLYLLNVSRLAE